METNWEGKISSVRKHSAAETAGIRAGESLCAVNGMPMRDILDVSFAAADFEPLLSVKGTDGSVREVRFRKKLTKNSGFLLKALYLTRYVSVIITVCSALLTA